MSTLRPESSTAGHRVERPPPATSSQFFEIVFSVFTGLFLLITFPISVWFCFQTVKVSPLCIELTVFFIFPRNNEFKYFNFQDYETAVLFRFGKLAGTRGPGLLFKNPFVTSVKLANMRTRFTYPKYGVIILLDEGVGRQDVLTQDGRQLALSFITHFRSVKAEICNLLYLANSDKSFSRSCFISESLIRAKPLLSRTTSRLTSNESSSRSSRWWSKGSRGRSSLRWGPGSVEPSLPLPTRTSNLLESSSIKSYCSSKPILQPCTFK
jgi:hypothetical protein